MQVFIILIAACLASSVISFSTNSFEPGQPTGAMWASGCDWTSGKNLQKYHTLISIKQAENSIYFQI